MKKLTGSIKYLSVALLGYILTLIIRSPATTHAFVITLTPDNTMILDPPNGMALRPFVDPPDERLGQAALQLTYEPEGERSLFNLVGITVATGSLNVGIQYEDGTIAVYNDLTTGYWPLSDSNRINRVTLECPSGGSCPSVEALYSTFRVQSLEIEPLAEPLEARFCCSESIRGKLPSNVIRGYTGCVKVLPQNAKRTCRALGYSGHLDVECDNYAWSDNNGVLHCY